MKKLYLKILYLVPILLIFNSISTNAALTWDPENGWGATGGILEPLIGSSISIKDAEHGLIVAQEECQAGNFIPAIRTLQKVYECYPNSIQAPDALHRIGLICIERHQYETAFNSLQTIILEYPGYPKFNEVIKIQFEIASQLQRGNRPYYWGIIPGFRDYDGAMRYFESIVTNAPYTEFAPMALMNIADLAKEHGRTEDVVDALDRIVSCYRQSNLAPCAYLKLGDTYASMVQGPAYDQGATIRSINYYHDFLFLFPQDPQVPEVEIKLARMRDLYARSKKILGDFYWRRNDFVAARIFYNETITCAPNSSAAEEAKCQLQLVENCVYAPPTWVDWIFGRYQKPATPAYLEDVIVKERTNEEFLRNVNEFPIRDVDPGYDEFAPGQEPVPAY